MRGGDSRVGGGSGGTDYSVKVAAETAAMDEVQDAERMALDTVQCLEEVRGW